MNEYLLRRLRWRTAELSVGPSTVRGAGARGVVRAARKALKLVRLRRFATGSRTEFLAALETETKRIRRVLPRGTRHWGIARKVVNIFLRQAAHNVYLSARFGLRRVERWLELPLDSHVAAGIYRARPTLELPRWRTIKGLTPDDSELFQAAGRKIARDKRVIPIHLEYLWWREPGRPSNKRMQRTAHRRAARRR